MPTLQDIFEKLQKKTAILENALCEADDIRKKLENAALSNRVQSSNKKNTEDCRKSPFRKVVFCFKHVPEIKHVFLEQKKAEPVSFRKLCKILVDYVGKNNLYDYEGNIICDDFLKSITNTESCSFFTLLKNIGKIIN